MTQLSDLSDAQVVLFATILTAESDLARLQILCAERNDVLTEPLLFRLLLSYLPAELETQSHLATFLTHLQHKFKDVSDLDIPIDTSAIDHLPESDTRKRLHELRFGRVDSLSAENNEDALATFLISWIQQLETMYGLDWSILQLLSPFLSERSDLQGWQDSCLLPLLRLQNKFYPGKADALNTKQVERLEGVTGIRTLMQFAEQDGEKAYIGRDLNDVVSPWVHGASRSKRRKVERETVSRMSTSWQDVNEWIYMTSHTNFKFAAKAVTEWDGPEDSVVSSRTSQGEPTPNWRQRYAQVALALVYRSETTEPDGSRLLKQLLDRAVFLVGSTQSSTQSPTQRPGISLVFQASRANLLDNALLLSHNPLTIPSEENLEFLHVCLAAFDILHTFRLPTTISSIVEIALFGSEEKQKAELSRILQQVPRMTKSDIVWSGIRGKLHVLRSGGISTDTVAEPDQKVVRFLGRLSAEYLDVEILDAILAAGQPLVANDIYLDSMERPLPQNTVKSHVVSAILSSYDNASNGNRTRGNIKRASEMLKAFQTKFTGSKEFDRIEHLIKATHSMSFYQITLHHGTPFQPVNIRVHKDPLALVGKILEQNHKAYTKLDDLLEIARDLVRAGLPEERQEDDSLKDLDEQIFDAEHRVTFLAITAALSDNDFDTAYSYITTRLSTNPSLTSDSVYVDDTSWRAAYAAGKHRATSSPKSLHERINGLSKRMDLLSLALTLTPNSDPLSEILAAWRRCEEEMDSLKAQAVEEERAFEAQGDGLVPGGFGPEDRELDAAETRRMMERRAMGGTGPTYEEEAPMGLFDVAKGAASAFRKSAFPLRGVGSDQFKVRQAVSRESPRSSMEGEARGDFGPDGQQRVRKRDMVSNMVTGGFVSGMSWVLGAPPPVESNNADDNDR